MKNRKADFLDNIGIASVHFKGPIKAILYKELEDFMVEEIHPNFVCSVKDEKSALPTNFPQRYIHATLVKKGISTFEACKEVAEGNKIPLASVSYCGLKDTTGITAQRICIPSRFSLKRIRFKHFFLKNFQGSNKRLNLRSHRGNRFRVKARKVATAIQKSRKTLEEFTARKDKALPNFYGPQRFGIRQNNHILGKLLLEKDYDKFIRLFLAGSSKDEPLRIRKAREKLRGSLNNLKECKKIIGNLEGLEDERELVGNLICYPKEEAVCGTQRSSFFVHSLSSYLFNRALSLYLEEGKTVTEKAFLFKIGADTRFDSFNAKLYQPVLEKEKMGLADFKHPCQALNIASHSRKMFFTPENFNFEIKKNEITLSFDLGIGEYASLFLAELFEGAYQDKLN